MAKNNKKLRQYLLYPSSYNTNLPEYELTNTSSLRLDIDLHSQQQLEAWQTHEVPCEVKKVELKEEPANHLMHVKQVHKS